ncbi:GNAT family N-acetyltransferase [Terriglobus albidus]|uniref:GNAT family N-acetyltransferase n=1 Tax=Terriglobus albidus TaxID=1592106 RepID=A0A5B9E858_9BACT|nr:GNAT family N-acetyltransferase [Terriglobus albidus]QEE27764.1 GNAT family N-acetyltransferase [Terriglobus albidus]
MTRSFVATTGSGLVLKRLQPSSELEFSDLLSLYEEAFPSSERKPVAVLRRMLSVEEYYFLLATENEVTVGFAIVRVLSGGTAALLEYMAVAPSERRRGIGGQIVLAAARAANAPSVTLLLEVESDRIEDEDRLLRTRRKQFYRSLGARELCDLNWIMPPVIATLPPPMEMMALGKIVSSVPRHQVQQWLTEIYVDVYEQSADDPRIEAMVRELPGEVRFV